MPARSPKSLTLCTIVRKRAILSKLSFSDPRSSIEHKPGDIPRCIYEKRDARLGLTLVKRFVRTAQSELVAVCVVKVGMGTSEPLVPHLNDACPRSMSELKHTSPPVASDIKRQTLPSAFGRLVDRFRFSRNGRRAVACDAPTPISAAVEQSGPLLSLAIDYAVDKAVNAAFGAHETFDMGTTSVKVPERPYAKYAVKYQSTPIS